MLEFDTFDDDRRLFVHAVWTPEIDRGARVCARPDGPR
jgi:hypothetical protein